MRRALAGNDTALRENKYEKNLYQTNAWSLRDRIDGSRPTPLAPSPLANQPNPNLHSNLDSHPEMRVVTSFQRMDGDGSGHLHLEAPTRMRVRRLPPRGGT